MRTKPPSGCQKLAMEKLECRRLLAGDWHNTTLRCDVDASGYVSALDALLVVNAINQTGSRVLPERTGGAVAPFLDVTGDDALSPLDVLLIINAINRAQPDVPIALSTETSSDPNGNGLVLRERVKLIGQTSAHAKVTLSSDRAMEPQAGAWTARADESGRFAFELPMEMGVNRFQVDILDEIGGSKSVTRELRRGDIVTDWNASVLNVIREWSTTANDPYQGRIVTARPPEVARNLAMIHAAMFDAINATGGPYKSYVYAGSVVSGTSAVAAGAAAAHHVASALYSAPDELALWDATFAESLASIPDDAARAKGVQLGKSIAQAMLEMRADDGSNAPATYAYQSGPGAWQRTFPDFLPPLLPRWTDVAPFVIANPVDFRAEAPPQLTSEAYAVAVDEVMRLGAVNSTERTPEQTQIAVFWADGGGTATPPGHWNRIATDVVNQESLSLVDSARTFALLNLALADAGIASWDSKYTYNLWRPIDAVRLADTDGNDATTAEAAWVPLLRTPPFPTYTSGHSTFSSAAAAVLTHLFGDNYTFTSTTDAQSAPGQRPLDESLIVTRTFTSFDHAAQEAGLSRIYGGIHFSFDNTAGLTVGANVGKLVVDTALRARV